MIPHHLRNAWRSRVIVTTNTIRNLQGRFKSSAVHPPGDNKQILTTRSSTCKSASKSKSLKITAEELTSLFEIDPHKSMQIAKLISNSTRKEISKAHQIIARAEAGTAVQSRSSTNSTSSIVKIKQPSKQDLRIHALTQGIPFIGFGIMDNAILIWAGDVIDTHLGVALGISTLCAAAIGNIISDLAGVGLGAYIEDFCSRRLNLPKIDLSSAQRNLRSVRMAGQIGICIGLTIGCIIGMFPLLWIDADANADKNRDEKINIERERRADTPNPCNAH